MKKNFIYSVLYQILLLIIPFITVPYVSRVLGTDGVGIYSYTYSVVYYFMLVSMLGINNYGNRTIAKVRSDKKNLSKSFFEIYTTQFAMTSLMIIIYALYSIFFVVEYRTIALIQIIYLISCLFDFNWFFFGLEQFKLTVTRNMVVKLLSLVFIFAFVKSKNDLWIYTMIMSMSTLISVIVLLPFLMKEIDLVKIDLKGVLKHIKPIFLLFIPVIAVSLYKVMDKIMLGSMCVIDEVGYYEQAEKLVNMPLGIITALGVVMLPRISNLVSKGEEEKVYQLINKSISFIMFLAFPICFGLIAVSRDFIPLFLGNDFIKSSILVYFLAPTLLFISFANVLRTQYLIPREKDRIYVFSVICGAVVNLIINFILIPVFQSIGACIGTIAAEFFVMAYQSIALRKELPIADYYKKSNVFLIKTLIMFIIVIGIGYINVNVYYRLVIQIIFGALVYIVLNFKYIIEIIGIKKRM